MVSLFLSVTAATLLITLVVRAWEEPTCDPDTSDPSTCNVAAPVNVGGEAQYKVGRFQIGNSSTNWLNDPITGFTEPIIGNDGALFVGGYTGAEDTDLRLYITDNAGDRLSIWGDTCGGGSCGDLNAASLGHYFTAGGDAHHEGDLTVSGTGGNVCHQVGGTWYSCRAQGGGENLAETLAIGNSAGSYNINMNGNRVEEASVLNLTNSEIGSYSGECNDGSSNGMIWFDRSEEGEPTLFTCAQGQAWELHFNVDTGAGTRYTDIRSDVFYDRNHTGYYIDPNSSSRMSRINLNYLYLYNWLIIQDNDSIRLGNGSDFRMWHNGTDTYFRNYHHGARWYLQGENAGGTNRALIYADPDSWVRLYYAGSRKMETTSAGIDVIGDLQTYDDIFVGSSSGDNGANLYLAYRMYDWDDTSYYVDPGGTSEVNDIRFRSADSDWASIDGHGEGTWDDGGMDFILGDDRGNNWRWYIDYFGTRELKMKLTGGGDLHIEDDYYGEKYHCNEGLDVAEKTPAEEPLEAAEVASLSSENEGELRRSQSSYEKEVAGIVSSNPGIILNDKEEERGIEDRDEIEIDGVDLAITGRVPVKTTTENGPVEVGDLLVSSSKPGYAMRGDPEIIKDSPGVVIGKAMESLETGEGEILVLILMR